MTKNQNGILVVEEMKTYSNLRPSRFAAGKNHRAFLAEQRSSSNAQKDYTDDSIKISLN